MRIFWRIFLSFWVATAILLSIVFSTSEPRLMHRLRDATYQPEESTMAFRDAVNVYEQHGAAAFQEEIKKTPGMNSNVLLFDADGRMLAPRSGNAQLWSPLASEVLRTQDAALRRINARVGVALLEKSTSGRTYVIVMTAVEPTQTRLYRPQFWTKLVLAMVPATLICLGLSLYITRPLTSLSLTANRLAEGDLTARPPEAQKRRRDELGALSRDIDVMAARINELLTAQRRFVASVSHELGAPLTRMQLAITMLGRELPAHRIDALDQIEREADRLSHLVQELLYLASLERGPVPAETFQPVSLATLCQEIVRDNAAEAEEGQCVVATVFEAVTLQGAPQALRRAIENVLRNAIRHSPPNSTVHFLCSASGTPGLAIVKISDSGPGVPEHMLSIIFQPFVRATRREGEGTGLGLAIAAEAVALHGGTIWAANRDSGGLAVTIRLPATKISPRLNR